VLGEEERQRVVIGERFAWAHLPKTAGDATWCILRDVPGLVTFADPLDSNDKHLPFFARAQEVSGKLLAMNIRRLPAWMLSAAHHRARHGVHPEYRPLPLQTADELTALTDPDDLLRWMTDHGRFGVTRWLRAEALGEDVLSLLRTLGIPPGVARRAVGAVGRVNQGSYDRTVSSFFSDEQIAALYRRNPCWATIERRVYGDLVSAA
jgi:hypothetical protein